MGDMIDDIRDFHEKFNLPQRHHGELPTNALVNFRLKFLAEELQEINRGLAQMDLAEVLDGLVDLVYVAMGTAWLLNLPFRQAWAEVQRANMEKVRATDPMASKRGTDLDVVKPVGWQKPRIEQLIVDADKSLKNIIRGGAGHNLEQLDLVDYINALREET